MTLSDLHGKKVAILGFGREGRATLNAIRTAKIACAITVLDASEDTKATGVTLRTGSTYLQNLTNFDVIIKSPGIKPGPELAAVAHAITTGTQIFLDTVIPAGALVIGVTGSKGKSTTTSLIHAILKAAKKDAHLVGNIGVPSLEHLDKAKKETIFALEMSSYQLMDLTTSPHIAVVTAFFPEHLDYHGSLEAYLEAKKHIARFQGSHDLTVFAADSPGAAAIAAEGSGRKIPFTETDSPVQIEETHLLGRHNLSNIAAAATVARYLGIDDDTIIAAVKAFHGLPHRLQMVGTIAGIDWVDDAISTTPESTIAGLAALGDRVRTIILGGQDRGYDFTQLARVIDRSAVNTVILFLGSGEKIREALAAHAKKHLTLHSAPDMPTAVRLAHESTAKGSICLLSTASPSYGMFKNFEDKGDQFQQNVRALS